MSFYSCPILLRYLGAKQQQRDGNSLCHTDSGHHAALLWRFNSITMVLSSFVYDIDPAVFSKVFMIAGNLLALGLTCLCYLGVFKCLERKEDIQNQYVLMILTPLLMILVVSAVYQSCVLRKCHFC